MGVLPEIFQATKRVGRKGQIIDVLLPPAIEQVVEPKSERAKSVGTLVGDPCGANAPGGGGFQPGNNCGSHRGGAGGAATAPVPRSRRDSVKEEILKAAEEIKFSDAHSDDRGDGELPSESVLRQVESQLTPQERDAMNRSAADRAANYRENTRASIEFDAEYHLDANDAYLWRTAGMSGPLVAAQVGNLVADNVTDYRQQDALISEIEDWKNFAPYGVADGTKIIDHLDAKLKDLPGYAGNAAIQQGLQKLRDEAQAKFAAGREQLRQQYIADRQAELEDRVLRIEQSNKREWLANLYEREPKRFGVETASGDGTWFADGKFHFSTSAGTRYEIDAQAYEDEGQGAEITFRNRDVAGNQFKITGTGNAHEVFSTVTPAIVAYAQHNDSDFLTFTAHEPSRRRLYDRLVRTVSRTLPDYAAVATGDEHSRRYIVYKREMHDRVQEGMQENGVPIEQLVKSELAAAMHWRAKSFALVASRWQKSRSDCGATGGPGPGGGGFDHGNVCAVGEQNYSAALTAYRALVEQRRQRREAEAGGSSGSDSSRGESGTSQAAPVERPAPESPAAPPRREISVQEAVDEALGPEPTAEQAATVETPVETPSPAPVDPNAPPMNRRERMRAEVLEAAKAVQFSDERYEGGDSFDPSDVDRDVIIDKLYDHLGYSADDIQQQVDELIDAHVPVDQQAAARSVLQEWSIRNNVNGLDAIDGVREAMSSVAGDGLNSALDSLTAEAEAAAATEVGTPNLFYTDPGTRDNWLTKWADDNRELFGVDASDAQDQKHGVWRPEDRGTDAYKFKAPSGEEFTVYASTSYSEFTDGVVDGQIRDIRFANDTHGGTYGVTGENQGGGARAVFSNVLPAVVAYVQEKQPDAIKFSAAKEHEAPDPGRPAARNDSRQRLYTRLVQTIAETTPDYFAIATSEDHGETKYYIIAKREYKDEIMERARQHDPNIEELVKSLREVKPFMFTSDWQPWVLRKSLLRRNTRNWMKSTATLERDRSDCGANAEGGGGFQPGNTCAAGGDGASEAGGTTPDSAGGSRLGARARMQKEILDAASKVKFSDTPVGDGDVDVSDLSDDDIMQHMPSRDETQMEEYLSERAMEYISEYADEYVDQNFDASIDNVDEEEAARDAGFSENDIYMRVTKLIQENVTDPTQAEELQQVVEDFRGYGDSGVDELRNELSSVHDIDALNSVMDELYDRAQYAMNDARDEQLDRMRDEFRDSFIDDQLSNWDDYEARSEYLQDWARNNPEYFASEAGDVEMGAWQKKAGDDTENEYRFEASNGQQYLISASEMSARQLDGNAYKRIDVQFANDTKGSVGVTGTGAAKEVFSNVVPAVVALAQKESPDVLTFSAAKEREQATEDKPAARDNSRQRLYDRLTRTVASALPEYMAVATKVEENDPYATRFYRIFKREHKDRVLAEMERADPGYEVLVKTLSHLWSLPALRKSILYRRTRRLKHLGPGDHPSGSPQSVHGHGGGHGRSAGAGKPSRGNVSQVEAEGLASLMLRKGGFTYQPIDDNSPTSGYALSVFTDAEHVIQDGGRSVEDMSADIYGYLQKHRDRFEDAKVHVGGWHDVEAKKIYLDLSVVESDRQTAIDAARQHKQEAIFDLGEFQTIMVKEEHERRKTLRRLLRKTSPAGAVRVVMTRPNDPGDAELQRVATAIAKGIARLEVKSLLAARRARRKALLTLDEVRSMGQVAMDRAKSASHDECGANAQGGGGFQPGNTCASGDGSGGGAGVSESSDKAPASDLTGKARETQQEVQKYFAGILSEATSPVPDGEEYHPNVEHDADGDGITDAARVGIPAGQIPPPPPIPHLPNLTPDERKVESEFAHAYEADPDKMAEAFRQAAIKTAQAKNDVPTFGTDDAKVLSDKWSGDHLTPEQRAANRAQYNVALHQTANAIAKRAFVAHLDTLQPGDQVLITQGGCGSGKGFSLKNSEPALAAKMASKAVWDSAGDQNSTENPWIQAELEKRDLKGVYLYVHADPKVSWAHEKFGVVQRAHSPDDGRMVDARVFADSYALGAKNHQAFYEKHRGNPKAQFLWLKNGSTDLLDEMPKEALAVDREELYRYAVDKIGQRENIAPRVKRGALLGGRVWKSEGRKRKE